MKINTYTPKFKPQEMVMFYSTSEKKLMLTTVEYCKYCPLDESWSYSLVGWSCDFKECDLQEFSPTFPKYSKFDVKF
jgi:hypothetical protein